MNASEPQEKNIFQRIIDREIPADIVFEDDDVIAFRDIQPQAPTHILIVPKSRLVSVDQASPDQAKLLGRLLLAVGEVVRREHLENGYRVVINAGTDGGQEVPHLHLHVLGGRKFSWPPG